MLLTGEQINAYTALNWGLVNEVVDVGDNNYEKQRDILREKILKLAEHINQYSGKTLAYGKKTFYNQINENGLYNAYKVATNAMCTNLCFKDTQEGITAFLQKRKPVFNSDVKTDQKDHGTRD